VTSLPGVEAMGTTSTLPLTGGGNTVRLYAQSKPVPPPGQENEANSREASATYFSTLGIPLLRGRFFDQRDAGTSQPRVVILNQTLARQLFDEADPIGQNIVLSFNKSVWQVVGVVGDAELASLDAQSNPAVYFSSLQDADTFATVVVRSTAEPSAVISAIQATVREMDADVPLFGARTIEEILASSTTVFFRKYLTALLSGFAVVALLLAAIGIYGVLSHGVAQRTHEFGIRMAIGAQRGDVLRLVLRSGFALVLTGVLLGLVGSLATGWAIERVLFGVSGHDPVAFVLGVSALLVAALAACWIPARRATRIDPMRALRYE
jgi:putative ABC transport system permease protein